MDHGNILLNDPTLWVLVSFVLFAALVFVFGRGTILGLLDEKIEKIRNQINSAEKLKADAQTLLGDYEHRLQNASTEAAEMIRKARTHAADFKAESERHLVEAVGRREAMLKSRIEQMERAAVEELRHYAADMAIAAAIRIIEQRAGQSDSGKLTDRSIDRIAQALA